MTINYDGQSMTTINYQCAPEIRNVRNAYNLRLQSAMTIHYAEESEMTVKIQETPLSGRKVRND